MAGTARKFRTTFKLSKESISWYPGHMKFSFIKMQAKMRNVDCVVEVHDSRIPFSGRNPKFLQSLIGPKPHILVFNKVDLINPNKQEVILDKCKQEEECQNILFTNCLKQKCKGLQKIMPMAIDLIKNSSFVIEQKSDFKMMVVGVPNVGKSSIINILRSINLGKGKATSVGALPGITKSVLNEIKISSDPPLYLIDTPGILPPTIKDTECGMKLALCACIKDTVVGTQSIADFLLFWMNKSGNYSYVEHFNLNEPVDDILPLLVKIAADNNYFKKYKNVVTNSVKQIPDLELAAEHMVRLYRKGKFGDLDLDKSYYSGSSDLYETSM